MIPTEKDIKGFLSRYGSWGKRLTSILETLAPEINQILSGGGWAIIKDDVERWQIGAVKVLTGKATEEETRETVYLSTVRIPTVTKKLATWYKGIDMIVTEKKNDAEKPVKKSRKTKKAT